METITLNTPIKRGEESITTVTLREPRAGDLRGLNLVDVIQMKAEALTTLLPRITLPPLIEAEVNALSAPDLLAMGAGVVDFFAPSPEGTTTPSAPRSKN